MPQKRNSQPKKLSKPTKSSAMPKNRPRRKRQGSALVRPNHVAKLLNMISDPCNADIEPGLHGTSEGVAQRYVTNFTPGSTSVCGYVVWFPSFHCGVSGGDYVQANKPLSCYFYAAPDTTTVPLNTVAAPFGSGAGGTASSIRDPFFGTAASSSVMDGRTLAACMKVRPVNSVSSIQGTVAFLDNIPVDLFANTSANVQNPPPTVGEMLSYSRKIERLGIDTYEVKHRPSETDKFFNEIDAPMHYTQTSSTTNTTTLGDSIAPRGIGFAWSGLATGGASTLLFTLYKIVEWRPSPIAGQPIPRPISTPTPRISELLSYLDYKGAGNWMFQQASNMMNSQIIRAAFTNAGGVYENNQQYLLMN